MRTSQGLFSSVKRIYNMRTANSVLFYNSQNEKNLFLKYAMCICHSTYGVSRPIVLRNNLEEFCVAREYALYFVDTTCRLTCEQMHRLQPQDFNQCHEADLVNTDENFAKGHIFIKCLIPNYCLISKPVSDDILESVSGSIQRNSLEGMRAEFLIVAFKDFLRAC